MNPREDQSEATGPKRIQLRRTKGWRKPEGAVVVARPSKWGNPFRVYRCDCCGHWDVIDNNDVTYLIDHKAARTIKPSATSRREALRESVRLFYDDAFYWFGGRYSFDDGLDVTQLAGRDLCCWCPLDQPCHAGVLLEIANPGGVGVNPNAPTGLPLTLSSDLPEPFAGVAGGRGDVDLPFVTVDERSDEGVELGSGGVGVGLLAAQFGGERACVVEAGRLAHSAHGSTLAKPLDKPSKKANTIGMTTTAANSATQTREEAVHMTAKSTYLVHCPQTNCAGCGGEIVKAHYGPRTVEVEACEPLLAQGWTGIASVLWHSQALELLTPASAPSTWQHRDGLVSFNV